MLRRILKTTENKRLLSIGSMIYNIIGRNKLSIKGKGNIISRKGNYLSKCNVVIIGDHNHIILDDYGKNMLKNCKIRIYGNNNLIKLGRENTFINADLFIEDNGNKITFDSQNLICGLTHVAAIEGQSIEFGSGSLFSTNVRFVTGDSHSILDAVTKKKN